MTASVSDSAIPDDDQHPVDKYFAADGSALSDVSAPRPITLAHDPLQPKAALDANIAPVSAAELAASMTSPFDTASTFDHQAMFDSMKDIFPSAARSAPQLKNVSHVHDQIMNWMLLNPQLSLRECADHFGYTQSWLSSLIHSDIFQARLKQKQDEVFSRIADSIPRKLQVVADLALTKLAEKVADSEDPDFILDAADKALHRMGFAPASARNPAGSPAQVNNTTVNQTVVVGSNDLAEARALMRQVSQLPSAAPEAIEGQIVND